MTCQRYTIRPLKWSGKITFEEDNCWGEIESEVAPFTITGTVWPEPGEPIYQLTWEYGNYQKGWVEGFHTLTAAKQRANEYWVARLERGLIKCTR